MLAPLLRQAGINFVQSIKRFRIFRSWVDAIVVDVTVTIQMIGSPSCSAFSLLFVRPSDVPTVMNSRWDLSDGFIRG